MKLLLIGCLLLPLALFAQDKNIIEGKTVQRSTGAPIPNASVFISGSSLGTISDPAGNFRLSGIPAGNFELIISSVGFTTVVHPFGSENLPLKLDVRMEPKVVELGEVTVEPFDPNGWRNWGKFFLDNFIGTSNASKRCRIVNQKALRFRFNEKKGILTVVADEPLIIVNNYLGYTLQYQLEEFTWVRSEGAVLFVGYSLFREMSDSTDRSHQRYTSRRNETYGGSMTHFMRSLYHDRLAEEGFELRKMARVRNYEKDRVRNVMASQQRGNISSGGVTVIKLGIKPSEDSLTYYRKIMQQPDQLDQVGIDLLDGKDVLQDGGDSTKLLKFSDYLRITYKKSREEPEYVRYRGLRRAPENPISTIYLIHESGLSIEPNGYYYPPQIIFSLDYWGWSEKISHMLPIGFGPTAEK
jgi:hypothetical protein